MNRWKRVPAAADAGPLILAKYGYLKWVVSSGSWNEFDPQKTRIYGRFKPLFGTRTEAWTSPHYIRVSVVLGSRLECNLGTCTKLEEYDAIRRGSQPCHDTVPQLSSAQRACCLVTECLEFGEHR